MVHVLNDAWDGSGPLLLAVWRENVRRWVVGAEALPFRACGMAQLLASFSG